MDHVPPEDVPSAEPSSDPPESAGPEPDSGPPGYLGLIRFILLAAPLALMALGWKLKSEGLLLLPAFLEFLVVVGLTGELALHRRGWEAAGLFIVGVLFCAFLFMEGISLSLSFTPFWFG